jgi:hypothetical protein
MGEWTAAARAENLTFNRYPVPGGVPV